MTQRPTELRYNPKELDAKWRSAGPLPPSAASATTTPVPSGRADHVPIPLRRPAHRPLVRRVAGGRPRWLSCLPQTLRSKGLLPNLPSAWSLHSSVAKSNQPNPLSVCPYALCPLASDSTGRLPV